MVEINKELCIGCGKCVADCIVFNLKLEEEKAAVKRDCMKCGHCVAVCPSNAVTVPEYEMDEVEEYDQEKFAVEPDKFLRAVKFRRSIRKYKKQKVAQEKLERVLKAGQYTATAVNSQDVRFILVQDELEKAKEMIWQGWKAYADSIREKSRGMARYIDNFYDRHKENPENDRLFFEAPALLIVAADMPIDGGLAAANVENMAIAEGLGVMYNGYVVHAIEHSEEVKEWLGLGDKSVCAAMILGYPDVSYKRTAPRRKADIVWK